MCKLSEVRVLAGAQRIGFPRTALLQAQRLATSLHEELLATYPETHEWGRPTPDVHAVVETVVAEWLKVIQQQIERFEAAVRVGRRRLSDSMTWGHEMVTPEMQRRSGRSSGAGLGHSRS